MSTKTATISLSGAPEADVRDLGELFYRQTVTQSLSFIAGIQRLISTTWQTVSGIRMGLLDFQKDRLLHQTRPEFLLVLDSDPDRANRLLAEYLYRFFAVSVPPAIKSATSEILMDFIHDFYIACTDKKYSRLRQYQDEGKPFAAWLLMVSRRYALDWIKLKKNVALDPFPEPAEKEGSVDAWEEVVSKYLPPQAGNDDRAAWRELLDVTVSFIKTLPQRQQLLLVLSAEGYEPRDMTEILGEAPERNKAISDDLRYARMKLMDLVESHLRKKNIGLSDYFNA